MSKKCLWLLLLMGMASAIDSPPHPRFEEIYSQQLDNWRNVTVIHDKETGQEVVCYWNRGPACWLTGRSWKP